jgi:ubiquinone biosynthesis protein
VIKHFEDLVAGELDLRLEAAAASQFSANTAQDAHFRVPMPVWSLSSRRVLVIDWAEGLAMGDVAAIRAAGHDTMALGERVLQLFLSHALRDGYFHADMHQGNLKVAENSDIIAFDFGIMGQIDEYTRHVYAEILMGFIHRDYRRVAEVHFEAGYVPADQDVVQFALALRAVGEPIFGMNAKQISMARLLAYLFEVTERFGMQTRTELILLQRTMVVVEGVARTLNPAINIWETAKPVVEKYIREALGPRAALRDLARTAQVLGRFGPQLPELLKSTLDAARERQTAPVAERPEPKGNAALPAAVAVMLVAIGVVLGLLI